MNLMVQCVVFGTGGEALSVLLVKQGDAWALPGGAVGEESLDEAARRELASGTGLNRVYLEQLYTFGPQQRTVTVAYYALVNAVSAVRGAWFDVHALPALVHDHDHIVAVALNRLKGKVRYQPIGFELLPEKFTLSQLQRVYELVLERQLDKRNFRKKILSFGFVRDAGETQQAVAHRAARLYRFDERSYRAMVSRGFDFELV